MKAVFEGELCAIPSALFCELVHKSVNKAKPKEYLSLVQTFFKALGCPS